MKFYNRDKELALLEKVRRVSFSVHSQMTVLTGRRRIGKTSLIFKSCEDTPTVYLFVSRSNETDLCLRFTSEIRQALDIYIPELTNFAEMFRFLMDLGTRMEYNLVIDEFQENPQKVFRAAAGRDESATDIWSTKSPARGAE